MSSSQRIIPVELTTRAIERLTWYFNMERPFNKHSINIVSENLLECKLALNPKYDYQIKHFAKDFHADLKNDIKQGTFALFSKQALLYEMFLRKGYLTIDQNLIKSIQTIGLKNLYNRANLGLNSEEFRLIMQTFNIYPMHLAKESISQIKNHSANLELAINYFSLISDCNVKYKDEYVLKLAEGIDKNNTVPSYYLFQFLYCLLKNYDRNYHLLKTIIENYKSILYNVEFELIREGRCNDFLKCVYQCPVFTKDHKKSLLLKAENYLNSCIYSPYFVCKYRELDDPKRLIRNHLWKNFQMYSNYTPDMFRFLKEFVFHLPGITPNNVNQDYGRKLYLNLLTDIATSDYTRLCNLKSYFNKVTSTLEVYPDVYKCVMNLFIDVYLKSSSVIKCKADTNVVVRLLLYLFKDKSISKEFIKEVQNWFLKINPHYYIEEMYWICSTIHHLGALDPNFLEKVGKAVFPSTAQFSIMFLDLVLQKDLVKEFEKNLPAALSKIAQEINLVPKSMFPLLRKIACWVEHLSDKNIRTSCEAEVFCNKFAELCVRLDSSQKNPAPSEMFIKAMAKKYGIECSGRCYIPKTCSLATKIDKELFYVDKNDAIGYGVTKEIAKKIKREIELAGMRIIWLPESLAQTQKKRLEAYLSINAYLQSVILP